MDSFSALLTPAQHARMHVVREFLQSQHGAEHVKQASPNPQPLQVPRNADRPLRSED